MKRQNNHPFGEDLGYDRTFLPIYAILNVGDPTETPLIPPFFLFRNSEEEVRPQ